MPGRTLPHAWSRSHHGRPSLRDAAAAVAAAAATAEAVVVPLGNCRAPEAVAALPAAEALAGRRSLLPRGRCGEHVGLPALPSEPVAFGAIGLVVLGVWVGEAVGVAVAACSRSRDERLCLRDVLLPVLADRELARDDLVVLDRHPPADAGRRTPAEISRAANRDGRPPAELGRARVREGG